jgi:hypothetical protein
MIMKDKRKRYMSPSGDGSFVSIEVSELGIGLTTGSGVGNYISRDDIDEFIGDLCEARGNCITLIAQQKESFWTEVGHFLWYGNRRGKG